MTKSNSIFMQITAAQGPLECELAVVKTLKKVMQEAKLYQLDIDSVERVSSTHPNGIKSVTLKITGEMAISFGAQWSGTILWQFKSPVRVHHGRKNWFVGIFVDQYVPQQFDMKDIRVDTMRAQGAGGQHVNKTDSAVRVTHLPTGIVAISQNERSQHTNKKNALELLSFRLRQHEQTLKGQKIAERWHQHYKLERGDPKRTFKEDAFLK